MASADMVGVIAEQLLPQFIPKDANATEVSFQFTMVPNNTYRVTFVKKGAGSKQVWDLAGYEEVIP
jgi:tartrate dehydratase alpha subunit/fumarate hydratase class I-like protein